MTDAKTLAYINLFAVLGSLENLCALDPAAGALQHAQPGTTIAILQRQTVKQQFWRLRLIILILF